MNYLRLAGQFAVILLVFAGVAALADWPVYRQIPPGHGIVMLTFVHSAERLAECRRLTAQEIAKLPPNIRRAQDCPRGRRPVYVELEIDGRPVYRANLRRAESQATAPPASMSVSCCRKATMISPSGCGTPGGARVSTTRVQDTSHSPRSRCS